MSISLRKFWLFLIPALAWGQGSQLPKYTVATLPSASSFPSYVVQVIDGANAADCSVGGGTINVFCKSQSGSWVPQSPFQSLTVTGSGNASLSAGVLNIPPSGGGFTAFTTPPISGQYVIVSPVSVTTSGTCATANTTSGQVTWSQACNTEATDTWHFNVSALTALGIPIGNVTAVYPFVTSGVTVQNTAGSGNTFLTNCSGTGVTLNNTRGDLGFHTSVTWPLTQFTSSTSLTVSTGNFNAMTCEIDASFVDGGVGQPRVIAGAAALVGAYVYYTGSPVTQPSQISVKAPLNYNSSNGTLSLPLPFDAVPDFGTANTYAVTSSSFTQAVSGLDVKFYALNASTSATPTLNVNGWGAWTIVGPCGSALTSGDISAYSTSFMVTDVELGGNNQWILKNPQVNAGCGGGGAVSSVSNSDGSLTISPTTGAVVGSINYAHAGTWSALETFSTGVSAAALTLSAITGSTQCLHVNTSGVVSGTGSDCGSGGGSGLTVGSTTISGGTSGNGLYDNAGVLGEKAFAPALANCTAETTNFSAAAASCYVGNAGSGITATLPSITTGAIIRIQNINTGTVTASFGSNFNCTLNGATTSTTTCVIANGSTGLATTDGTNWYVFVAPSSTGSGSVNVNGSTVASPNFNGTTPSAANGIYNTSYSVSGSNVSNGITATGNPGAIYASSYGVKADGVILTACSTNGTTTVTCTDGNFSSGDVGKYVFGTNCQYDTCTTATVVVPEGTISSVTDSTHIVVSVTATGTFNPVQLAYGHLDSALFNVAQTTSNDPLFAAWTAASNACVPLILPAGIMLTDHGQFDTFSTSTPCAQSNAQLAMRKGYSIQGAGYYATQIVIMPNVPATDCTGPNGAASGCFFSLPTLTLRKLTLTGLGNSSLTGFSGKIGVDMPGINVNGGTNYFISQVGLWGWGGNTSGFLGLQLGTNGSNDISGAQLDESLIENFGLDCAKFSPSSVSSSGSIQMTSTRINVCTGKSFELTQGTLNSVNGKFGYASATSQVVVDSGAVLYSVNDQWPWSVSPLTNNGNAALEVDGTAYLRGDILSANWTNGIALNVVSGGVAYVGQTTLTGGTGGEGLQTAGTTFDQGNPSFTSLRTGSGALVRSGNCGLINTHTTSVAEASVTFSNIYQGCTNLRIVIAGESSSANDGVEVQLNGDTATNYNFTNAFNAAGTPTALTITNNTSSAGAQLGTLSNTTALPGQATCTFASYSGTTFNKLYSCIGTKNGTDVQLLNIYGAWANTAAITSIKFFLVSGGNFQPGTAFNIYADQ